VHLARAQVQKPEAAHRPAPIREQPVGALSSLALQLQGTIGNRAFGQLVQRTVVQSDWLKFDRSEKGLTILSSATAGGPWTAVHDKSSVGYRDQAEATLGDTRPLWVLGKYELIAGKPNGTRNPFTRSHLIAGEFGGQKKFGPPDNIRYHPETLEYGGWQRAENHVTKKGKEGFITSVSSEVGAGRPALMAAWIVNIVRAEITKEDAERIERALEQKLQCTKYVPFHVEFNYVDVSDESASLTDDWADQSRGLDVNAAAPKENVYKALLDMGIALPAGVEAEKVRASTPVYTIDRRERVVELIKGFDVANERKQGIIERLNRLIDAKNKPDSKLPDTAFQEQLNKLKEVTERDQKIKMTVAFSTFEKLTLEEVKANK
jgi:hypothetical protein